MSFQGRDYIRIGSYKQNLKDHPEKERELWRAFDKTPFEDGVAHERTSTDEVLRLLDYPAYFELTGQPLPADASAIIEALESEGLIKRPDAGGWNVTNLGAILFARRLDEFPSLRRKAVRVIQYPRIPQLELTRVSMDAGPETGWPTLRPGG